MNAAFLLVTSAWLAGQAAPPPPAQSAPPAHAHPAPLAPVAPVAPSACCDTGHDACCESGGGLFGRLRGWFHRRGDDCDSCDTCGGHHRAAWSHHDGGCGACDDGCEGGFGRRFRDRLRGWFRRGGDCCDVGAADCCGAAGAPHAPPPLPRPEPIPAPKSSEPPKEMPKGSTSGAGILLPQPALTPATTLIIDR